MPGRDGGGRWWLRHAPAAAAPGSFCGRIDPPPELGDDDGLCRLARLLPRHLPAFASPLARSRLTARALGLALPVLEPGLMEQDFGSLDGRRYDSVSNLAELWADPVRYRPAGGESFADLCRRVARTLAALPPDCVIVSHAGPIRAAMALARGLSPAEALGLAVPTLCCIRIEGGTVTWVSPSP